MFQKFRGIIGLAGILLKRDRLRTSLAIVGVVLAVLSATLLASVGLGVVETGQQKFDNAGRDLWITGGPTSIQPGTIGGFEPGIVDAHTLAEDLGNRSTIRTAAPMLFQTVYLGPTNESLDSIVAVGLPSSGGVGIQSGTGFSSDREYYANGAYNGTPSRELVISTQLTDELGVTIEDRLHVGGTVTGAKQTQYEIVGMTSTFSQFLGTPTVVMPLAELQTMTGNMRTDRATVVTIDVVESANMSHVESELETAYPQYTIQTNQEQLQSVLASRILIIAGGVTLVVIAVLAGLALTANLLALFVVQQREVLAALQAIGIPRRRLIMLVMTQGLLIGAIGGGIGVAMTPVAGAGVNWVASTITGFSGLVQTPRTVLIGGSVLATIVGFVSAAVAGRQVAQIEPLDALE